MDSTATSPPVAWQPLTFRGVAAFAQAPFRRLILVQFVVALLSAATVLFFFESAWTPSIDDAIDHLPDQGEIRDGELQWTGPTPERLGKGSFVSFVVDPDDSSEMGEAADLEWTFTRRQFLIRSLFGFAEFSYPAGQILAFNRQELKPWWGAWRPSVYAAIGALCIGGLFAAWCALAALYAFPTRLIAFYADREVTWTGAWRLGGAAVLPGALFMDAAILAYTFHRLNLLQLLSAGAAHFVVGWIYVIAGPTRLPAFKASPGHARGPKNPFAPSTSVPNADHQ